MRQIVSSLIVLASAVVPASASVVDTGSAYGVLSGRTEADTKTFYIYQDADSGFNHGSPSGFFFSDLAALQKIHENTACLDDPSVPSGCSADPNRLDRNRINVLRIAFDPLTPTELAGVNIEEPENWGANHRGIGYNLRGSSKLVFDARSPDQAHVQFGVGGCVTSFMTVPSSWLHVAISVASLRPPPGTSTSCPPNLSNVHLLFTVATNGANASRGGSVLLDNIHFEPVPTEQTKRPSFPLATQTFGVIPLQQPAPGRVSIPPDQALRNLTTTYESALASLAFLSRKTPQDLKDARLVADAFDYALHHDNRGDPLPHPAQQGLGLHNGYISGDLALHNDEGPGAGQAGQVRLSGFSGSFCGPTKFCLVLDGATGGNNAFAILALLSAYRQFGKPAYLDDALTIANWIIGNLTDTSGTGFGGYVVGYPDTGTQSKTLIAGKSIENNADIFVAFSRLSAVEKSMGHLAAAAFWTGRANVAGDFVMAMFDEETGCFFAGTVPEGTPPSPGIIPSGSQKGNDVINTFLFLDSDTFTTEGLAPTPRYRNKIDWRRPIRCVLDKFGRTVSLGGRTYQGFSIDTATADGPEGIAWEFTGQAVVVMRLIDSLYGETALEADADLYLSQIRQAQLHDPFGDGRGLVASTLMDGDSLLPIDQCLTTPFQCIPERVGLAATAWAIFAERKFNPLSLMPSAPE